MKELPKVILVCVTTVSHGKAIESIHKTLALIKPAKTIFFTDVLYLDDAWQCIIIDRINNLKDYSRFIVKELGKYIPDKYHVLIIQSDGYVINDDAWSDDFLNYDYIGAPWNYKDGRNVGNGGFSLRSARLQHILCNDTDIKMYHPEDEATCRLYRQYLEDKWGIEFAPDDIAHSFSFEMHRPLKPTFGFHRNWHQPYKEPIILKRSGAMGDVVMMEPVMEHFYTHGYRVIIDTAQNYYNLFANHYYPVELLAFCEDRDHLESARVVDLDMAYEVRPKHNVLESYAHACGVKITPRNPRLNFHPTPEVKIFNRYVVIHTDDTGVAHRNVHGVEWSQVEAFLFTRGFLTLRVGNGNGRGGWKINTFSENMLAYIISGANYFIGVDSGPSQIAVACNVKSAIFFGSVNPLLRYDSFERIMIMQKECPIGKDGCYHEQISVNGRDCEVDAVHAPCIGWHADDVIEQLKSFCV